MAIRELVREIAELWPTYLAGRKVNKQAGAYDAVVKQFPSELRQSLPDPSGLLFFGSTGVGNVTKAPWVATFETSVTSSATTGFYVVYLFSLDMAELSLCIGFGATQFVTHFTPHKKAQEQMVTVAERLRGLFSHKRADHLLPQQPDLKTGSGDVLHSDYESATCFSTNPYIIESLPSNESMLNDYQRAIGFYREIVADPVTPSVEQFVESGLTLPQWTVASTATVFEPLPYIAMKSKGRGGKGNRKRRTNESAKIGRAGEEAVMDSEEAKLATRGQVELIPKIQPHFRNNEYPGWDITSFDESGLEIYIEVKSSSGKTMGSIELTNNEWAAATAPKTRNQYHIYLATEVLSASGPKIRTMKSPADWVDSGMLSLTPSVFELSLRSSTDNTTGV